MLQTAYCFHTAKTEARGAILLGSPFALNLRIDNEVMGKAEPPWILYGKTFKLWWFLPHCFSLPLNSCDEVARWSQQDSRHFVVLTQYRALDSRTRTTTSTKFSHSTTVSARKPASFWREKRDTVVILVRDFAKKSSCQNKSTTGKQFCIFRSAKRPR